MRVTKNDLIVSAGIIAGIILAKKFIQPALISSGLGA